MKILRRFHIDPEGDDDPATDDDPVPDAVIRVLPDLDTSGVYEALQNIPQRRSATYEERLKTARRLLADQLKELWKGCLTRLQFKLPLLVMDEAHHLKNPEARLSGLFKNPDAKNDAEEIRGSLGGIFERMLFLTATPFQLGHDELCSVLQRFEGIAWDAPEAPSGGQATFHERIDRLRQLLDAAQKSALSFDHAWGWLRPDDLMVEGQRFSATPSEMEDWWSAAKAAKNRTSIIESLLGKHQATFDKMRATEEALRPWVIRHLKERTLNGQPRRERLAGQAVKTDRADETETGIEVEDQALLPFLLAARATACTPDQRPVFAEGLASSYEAFLHTRKPEEISTDGDDDDATMVGAGDAVGQWYLDQLQEVLPFNASAKHPKLVATAQRVMDAWKHGEKVVVFCHYIQTGRVLRQVISGLVREEIKRQGVERLRCSPDDADEAELELDRLGARFFDTDSPVRRACDAEIRSILGQYPTLGKPGNKKQNKKQKRKKTPSFFTTLNH